jgi:ubiquinone/menaquinone biosynthesis C-methylase UbiE
VTMTSAGRALSVTDFFDGDAANWDTYYERDDLFSVIHQHRRSMALAWVDELKLPDGARVLEVGCGTGLFAIDLAQRGFRVTAVDSAARMLARARANIAAAKVVDRIALVRADSERLPLSRESFDLVVALGLVPWVPSPANTLTEMVGMLIPGGRLVVNCDNRRRLAVLLDPRYTPPLAGVRWLFKRLRRRDRALDQPITGTHRHVPSEFDALLAEVGAPVERSLTFGFGPFTLLGREALPSRAGLVAHRGLQRLAEAGTPGLWSTGAQYMVRAVRA